MVEKELIMKLFIHADLLAVEDLHYHFRVGEYYRLPLYGSVKIKPSGTSDMYIRIAKNCSHPINARLVKKFDKTIYGTTKNLPTRETGSYEEWSGLAYFQIELGLFHIFYFFTEYSKETKGEFESLCEGEYYSGSVDFYLTCGIIDSIVEGLWDEFDIPQSTGSWKRFPYGILKIENLVMEEGIEIDSVDDIYPIKRKSDDFIIGCDWLFNDDFGGKVLSYYAFENGGKLDFKSIGTFQFALIDMYFEDYPEYLAIINGEPYVLRQILFEPIDKIVEQLEMGHFMENGYHICWSLEDRNFKFYDGRLINISQWEESDPYDRTIIVQFTNPDEAEVLTTTSIGELKSFVEWNTAAIERHKKLLNEAKVLGYKFDWDIGQKT